MGSSKPKRIATGLSVTTSYGGATEVIDFANVDFATLLVDFNAGSGADALVFKIQHSPGPYDLYRVSEGVAGLDEISIPMTASTNGQKRAVRLDVRGVNKAILDFKAPGLGTLVSVDLVMDGTDNSAPVD